MSKISNSMGQCRISANFTQFTRIMGERVSKNGILRGRFSMRVFCALMYYCLHCCWVHVHPVMLVLLCRTSLLHVKTVRRLVDPVEMKIAEKTVRLVIDTTRSIL